MEEQKEKVYKKPTSKANMEKARLKILEQRRQAKLEQSAQKYEISSSDSDSSGSDSGSDEPVIYIKNKKPEKRPVKKPNEPVQVKNENDNLRNELNELKNLLLQKNKKKDKKKKKKVIQIIQQPQQTQSIPIPKADNNTLEAHLKRKILNF
jgi:hypothetical protein